RRSSTTSSKGGASPTWSKRLIRARFRDGKLFDTIAWSSRSPASRPNSKGRIPRVTPALLAGSQERSINSRPQRRSDAESCPRIPVRLEAHRRVVGQGRRVVGADARVDVPQPSGLCRCQRDGEEAAPDST